MRRDVAPTRAELLRARRQLARVDKGAALLRRKREALVRELFPLARPAAEARREIAEAAIAAYRAELAALAIHGEDGVVATAWPTRDLSVDVSVGRVWAWSCRGFATCRGGTAAWRRAARRPPRPAPRCSRPPAASSASARR